MKSKEQKRTEAKYRQGFAVGSVIGVTASEQLQALDARLGAGVGAKRERAKLAAMIAVHAKVAQL